MIVVSSGHGCDHTNQVRHDEVLAELKPGNGGSPLFIFPGISGVALEFAQLARLIRYDGLIYGNQPRGLDGEADQHRSVTEMAA
jgi:hypothetical protein